MGKWRGGLICIPLSLIFSSATGSFRHGFFGLFFLLLEHFICGRLYFHLQRSVFYVLPFLLIKRAHCPRNNAHLYLASETRIPPHVRKIATEAFERRSIIEKVQLPNRLCSIGSRAFHGCVSLQDIFIPAQVSELGCDAFSGCDALTKAQIASSALSIPQGMFQEDRQLRSVRFHPQSQVQKIQKRAFSECKSLTTLILPPGLTEINDHAFYRCKSLDTIQFPEHLRRIGGQAFYFCGFPSIELPDSLEILEESAFFKCTQLTYVRIPKIVRFIGKWAFHGCNRLQYLEIRHDPDFIGEWIINRSATIRCYQGSKVDQYCQASGFKTEYL